MYEERLWKMSFFSEKRRQRAEDLVSIYREYRDRFSQRHTMKRQDEMDTSWNNGSSA